MHTLLIKNAEVKYNFYSLFSVDFKVNKSAGFLDWFAVGLLFKSVKLIHKGIPTWALRKPEV